MPKGHHHHAHGDAGEDTDHHTTAADGQNEEHRDNHDGVPDTDHPGQHQHDEE